MQQSILLYASIITSLCVLVTGCNTQTLPKSIHEQNQATNASNFKVKTQEKDGVIVSLTPIVVPHTSSGMETYKMMYWSDHIKTEAFVAVPNASGNYPLFVSCHGGYDTAVEVTHAGSLTGAQDLEYAQNGFITLIPEYRGYVGSDGTVPDFNGITLDTNNAINAIEGKYHIEPNHIYLEGASMGGGVVLKLATERKDIRSVIALSPFVGWDVVGQWAQKNQDKNARAANWYDDMTTVYGTFKPTSLKYEKESIDYQAIHVPTLLLQGTGDTTVDWQTVQLFYNDLRKTNSNTKLDLFPGGQHGLHGKYQSAVNKDISQWFQKYGEGASF